MKKISTLLLFVCISFSLYGQWNYHMSAGVRVAAGVSTLKGLDRYDGLPANSIDYMKVNNRFSWDVGLTFRTDFENNFVYWTEGNIGIMGAALDGVYREEAGRRVKVNSVDLTSLQLTINFGKKIPTNGKANLLLALGTYIDYDLGIGLLYDLDKESVINGYDANFKAHDLGAIITAGVEFQNVQLAFVPRFGFTNISPTKSRVYHRAYKIALTYYFGR